MQQLLNSFKSEMHFKLPILDKSFFIHSCACHSPASGHVTHKKQVFKTSQATPYLKEVGPLHWEQQGMHGKQKLHQVRGVSPEQGQDQEKELHQEYELYQNLEPHQE